MSGAAWRSLAAPGGSRSGPPPSPWRRFPTIYCYTGNRAQEEAETARRFRGGLCLKCLPNDASACGDPFAFGSCPLHDQAHSKFPRANSYSG